MTAMTYVRAFDHTSELLEGNAWGDPHVRKVHVYLPPDYSDRRKDPYPVVYLLAGWSGRGAHYLSDQGAFSANLTERLDGLIGSKSMPPTIVVFPDGSSRLGASQYVNSSVNGPYMDYLCDELVQWVDRRFHTHASRDHRGLIGHSSGGFGAQAAASERPTDARSRRREQLRHARSTDAARGGPAGRARHRRRDAHAM